MTNEQLYLSIGIPCFLMLINLITTNSQLAQLRAEIGHLRTDMGQLRSEMVQLRFEMHKELITFRDMIHADMVSLHERVAKVENR